MIMGLTKHNCAFDDSSILKLCEIKIPNSYQIFFKAGKLSAKNHSKLITLIDRLDKNNIPKFRFVPAENIEANIIKVANQLLKGYNIQMLGSVFKVEMMDQLKDFNDKIIKKFEEIVKSDDIEKIKSIFVNNLKTLSKGENTPQDDDIKIIAGYCKYGFDGNKYLISEDEHFWGYSDLISKHFKIHVVKEWECHLLLI